jgi:beta-glucosidase/6-phospho-beta-glucosidase/beta-galactosidase
VLIAENGMALRRRPGSRRRPRKDRMTRSQFLRLHVHEVTKIRADGVPLAGYLHWSLFDNYEWGTYTPRFGLYHIDYPHNVERQIEDPDGDRPAETYATLIAEARAKTPQASVS